ncbi:MAG: histidinol-phosphate transaminase [Gammaproteobacteria bacterium]|nr:MAG: histidinol-phosphate transaminase [Gammaproteobacteria bacterium]
MDHPDTRYEELAVPGVRALHPYTPGKPIAELEREYGIRNAVKLASNENPLGPPPAAIAAAQQELAGLARYPEGSGNLLTAALAEKHAVPAEAITLGNGSNDVLDMVARVFLGPGGEAVFSRHAFAVYPIVVQAVGARARLAAAQARTCGHDLDAMVELVGSETRVVFIANPNNPTGTWLAEQELHRFVADLPEHVIVVIDEAYFEYVEQPDYPDTSRWLAEFPNLVVTRTFSKAYGLAGLRVGYAVSAPGIADLLNRVRHPFNVNSVAQAAAVAALNDSVHLEAVLQLNRDGMQQLETGFKMLGLSWIPSVGNFVTMDTGQDATAVYERLLQLGVIVRPVANYGLPEYLRVTVGLPEENERFLSAIARALA